LEYTNYPKRGPRTSKNYFTDDSGEEIKYFHMTKIEQNKHLEIMKILQYLLAISLQCFHEMDQRFCLFWTTVYDCFVWLVKMQVRWDQVQVVSHMMWTT